MVTGLWYIHVQKIFSVLILKVQRTSMCFKSSYRALEDVGSSWLGFGSFILIWIWSLVFYIPMFQILALILILKVQGTSTSFKSSFGALEDAGGSWLGFGILILFGYGHWSFIYPWSKFLLSTKKHPCPLSPNLGLWRTLEVPDSGLAPWSQSKYGHWCLMHPWSKFLLYLDFEGAKNIHVL